MTALAAGSRIADGSDVTAANIVDRAIRVSTALAVLAVAGVAAYVSYWHAYAVVRAHGEGGITARLEPATIDGLVYASSMVVLYAARHRLPVPPLARWLLGLGIAATLTANMAQGWSHGPVGAVVAAWPAVSLVGSYELLLWLIRTAGTAEQGKSPESLPAGATCCARLYTLPDTTADDEPQRRGYREAPDQTRPQAPQPARQSAVPASSQRDDEAGESSDVDDAAVAAYLLSVQAGNPLSERKLASRFDRSRRWARGRIAEARELPLPGDAITGGLRRSELQARPLSYRLGDPSWAGNADRVKLSSPLHLHKGLLGGYTGILAVVSRCDGAGPGWTAHR